MSERSRVIYLHGFASGPQSSKARFFREKLAECGRALEAPDLTGGDFENLTMSGQLRILEQVAAGDPVTLIGSSLGGWLAALYASRHPETAGLILLAPAFDFNTRWHELVGAEAFARWQDTGKLSIWHHSENRERNLSFQIVAESADWPARPVFPQPAEIYHGVRDTVVPVEISERYAIFCPNVRLTLLDSDHGLIDALPEIWRQCSGFLAER